MTSATGSSGFTLLELLIVLAIMVLLAGAWPLAAPHFFPAQQLRNENQRLVAALRTMRTAARTTGTIQELDISEAGNAYLVTGESHALPGGFTLRLRADGPLRYAARLQFFPDGSSTGGMFDLGLPDRHLGIRVGRMTGRAEIVD